MGGQFVVDWACQAAKHHRKAIILLNDPDWKQRNPFWLLEFILVKSSHESLHGN